MDKQSVSFADVVGNAWVCRFSGRGLDGRSVDADVFDKQGYSVQKNVIAAVQSVSILSVAIENSHW